MSRIFFRAADIFNSEDRLSGSIVENPPARLYFGVIVAICHFRFDARFYQSSMPGVAHLLRKSSGKLGDLLSRAKKPAETPGFYGPLNGRSERIRTSGPCLPKTVLYQAELHSDT